MPLLTPNFILRGASWRPSPSACPRATRGSGPRRCRGTRVRRHRRCRASVRAVWSSPRRGVRRRSCDAQVDLAKSSIPIGSHWLAAGGARTGAPAEPAARRASFMSTRCIRCSGSATGGRSRQGGVGSSQRRAGAVEDPPSAASLAAPAPGRASGREAGCTTCRTRRRSSRPKSCPWRAAQAFASARTVGAVGQVHLAHETLPNSRRSASVVSFVPSRGVASALRRSTCSPEVEPARRRRRAARRSVWMKPTARLAMLMSLPTRSEFTRATKSRIEVDVPRRARSAWPRCSSAATRVHAELR